MNRKNNFQNFYQTERKKIDSKLSKLLIRRHPQNLYEPVSYILSAPGKRLRPFLVLISAKAAGCKISKVYNAALAVEMLHTFTLAHDDIMDNADKRRGHLTLHKKYDLSTAILAGDSLLSIAYEYLLKDLGKNSKEVIEVFTRSLIEVCEGQSLDKEFEVRNEVTLPEYIHMITQKTARMVEACCSIGARIGGGKPELVKALEKFGRNIGIAFQIQDDLLDIIADEAEFGKKIGGDLLEGKKTFLFLRAIEKADGTDKKLLDDVIEKKGISEDLIPVYKELYKRLGVLDDAKKEINRYTSKAMKNLLVIKKSEDREIFTWLANLLIKRTN